MKPVAVSGFSTSFARHSDGGGFAPRMPASWCCMASVGPGCVACEARPGPRQGRLPIDLRGRTPWGPGPP